MRTVLSVCLTLTCALLVTQVSLAQRGAGGGGAGFGFGGDPLMLAMQESVQKELSLSSDQVDKLGDVAAKRRESFQSLQGASREERRERMQEARQANDTALAAVLDEKQMKRLRQISLQQQGAWALADDNVAKSLNLSDDQKKQVEEIQAASGEEMRALGQRGDRQQGREQMTAIRRGAEDKLKAVLTTEQQAEFTQMQGEPFSGEIRRGAPGGGRQQQRRR